MCAIEPLVIQAFDPLRTHPSRTLLALVSIPLGFDPKFGSVRPKHPITFPAAISGNHLRFWSSLPNWNIGYIQRAPCTDAKLLIPESPASSSCITNPYATLFIPAQPYSSGRLAPRTPSSARLGISWVGKRA